MKNINLLYIFMYTLHTELPSTKTVMVLLFSVPIELSTESWYVPLFSAVALSISKVDTSGLREIPSSDLIFLVILFFVLYHSSLVTLMFGGFTARNMIFPKGDTTTGPDMKIILSPINQTMKSKASTYFRPKCLKMNWLQTWSHNFQNTFHFYANFLLCRTQGVGYKNSVVTTVIKI